MMLRPSKLEIAQEHPALRSRRDRLAQLWEVEAKLRPELAWFPYTAEDAFWLA